MQKILFIAALALGGWIAYLDSRPNWDDTGVSAAALLLAAAACGFLGPQRPWLWALALGIWIPLLGLAATPPNFGSLLALAVSFAGAYLGLLLRRAGETLVGRPR